MNILLRLFVASLLLSASCDAKSKDKKKNNKDKKKLQEISLALECASDDDCQADSQYCSGGLCQEFGFCRSLSDCLNPSNMYNSILCLGYTDCVDNQCTTICGPDICPGGEPSVRCAASPCSVSTCISPTTCVDYYCGGCNALFFDPKGDLACGSVDGDGSGEPTPPEDERTEEVPEPQGTCSSDDDCTDQFCAGGVCQDHGTCRDLVDCLNPSNEYNTILCVGYIDCVDNQCTRQCSDSECPEDQPLAECEFPPCIATTCMAPAMCVDYVCGGCHALCFDPTGDVPGFMIDGSTPEPSLLELPESETTLCEFDSDCNTTDQYCSQGECRNFGACSSDFDCYNPSNIYSTIFCTGPVLCQEGFCGRVCGGECPENGGDPVPCGEATCDPKECGDEARCVLNDCDGCSPLYFDPAGRQVCGPDDSTGVSPEQTCSSDDDCVDQFCAGGVCRDHGTCRDLTDCLNPSNEYGTVRCVGYIDCVDNQCIRECSNSDCPKGEPFTECEFPPCIATTCLAPSVCVDYYCGGCNAICIDPTGNAPGFPVEDPDTPVSDGTCGSDADCSDGEYCAAGTCLEFGSCNEDVDCFNPSNMFPMLDCIGYVKCSRKGTCRTICGSSCPNNEPLVRCFEAPCEANPCDEDYVSCIDNYCGACNSIFFNAEGKEVCASTDAPDDTGSDCSKKMACPADGSWFSRSTCAVKKAFKKARCAF
ncbi:hypothetical protein FisN_12Lh089 [Fistulifera solaris]|uniref:Disintegrin domain-containing protein n=1 Tax=Fistulifera solaris TaxID=1519565 RepID=A0A1Z5JMH7_FISSO|nr:hypothetical protein FisN_12Lh089 [Fistulifera solaris]|eukprot:GAX15205.1 hypothetical protein FisN_12Lh089 [Fistulifera solaris]